MKRMSMVVLLAIAVLISMSSMNAKADGPATDSGYWGLQVPHAERFMITPCHGKKLHQAPCYWNQRDHGFYNGPERSFWIIKIGHKWCKKFWDPQYNRHQGRCHR